MTAAFFLGMAWLAAAAAWYCWTGGARFFAMRTFGGRAGRLHDALFCIRLALLAFLALVLLSRSYGQVVLVAVIHSIAASLTLDIVLLRIARKRTPMIQFRG